MTRNAHDDSCVVFCTKFGGKCLTPHECWCRDGGRSYDDFAEQHPLWAKLPSAQWLDTDEGTVWDRQMREAKP